MWIVTIDELIFTLHRNHTSGLEDMEDMRHLFPEKKVELLPSNLRYGSREAQLFISSVGVFPYGNVIERRIMRNKEPKHDNSHRDREVL